MACACVFAISGAAGATDDFYGKTDVRLIVGTAVGGSYDVMGRLTARHIGKHIPGKPSILVQNMPGGGSLVAANHLYNVADQDGSILGAVVPGIIFTALFKEPSARYDPRKFQWIGNAMDAAPVPTIFHTAPVRSLAEIKEKEVVMGAGGISSMDATNAFLFNELLGTRIRVIPRYEGGDAINLAMERGEIHGRASQAWSAWKSVKPDWVREGKLIPLLQIALAPIPDPQLKDVPLLIDLAKSDKDRQLARIYTTVAVLGRPLLMGPGVPAERVAAVRAAYRAMVDDAAFRAEAQKQGLDLAPIYGEQIQTLVGETYDLDPEQVERLKSIIIRK